MTPGTIIAVVVSVLSACIAVATILIKVGRRDGSIDLAINEAARKAKHDAIDEVSAKILDLDERKLSVERYEADREADRRRLDVLERQVGLDGTGPHRRE